MAEYRCYVWIDADGIAEIVKRHCADDAGAMDWGADLFAANPQYSVIEIWGGDRLVDRRDRLLPIA